MNAGIGRKLSTSCGNQGFALVAALLLVVVVGIVAATVLQTTSTEVNISGNHRQAVQDFYAAEAGLAEGQARVRNQSGAESFHIADVQNPPNPFWSAYILTSSTWKSGDDPNFSPQYLNFIPQPGNPSSTAVQANSSQSAISYWVKLRHKTEYDAEQAGHSRTTPHYVDNDGSTSKHRSPNVGNVIYYGYPTIVSTVPQQFTTQGTTPWLPVEVITAQGGQGQGGTLLEAEMVHPTGPNQVGALYVVGNVSLMGHSGIIHGQDACGHAPALSPVYFGESFEAGATYAFDGMPANPLNGGIGLNLDQTIADLETGATLIQPELINQGVGASEEFRTNLLKKNGNGLFRIQNVSGNGILLVPGDALIEGQVSWNGMIIVSGNLMIQGVGTVLTVNGGIWSKAITQTEGTVNLYYDSCQIKSALLAQPLKKMTWREIL